MPIAQFETGQQLVKRFRAIQEAKEEFWDRWVKEIFLSLLKQKKWCKHKRDSTIRDVVLRKDETAAGQTYKYAQVIGVHTGLDRKIRSVDVEYKIPGESNFRVTTRPIHKLVLVVPVEEQTLREPEEPEKTMEEEENTYTKRAPESGHKGGTGWGDGNGEGSPLTCGLRGTRKRNRHKGEKWGEC
jgi:hypothetical protein